MSTITVRFNGESNLGGIHRDVSRLRAEFANMQRDAIRAANVSNGYTGGYENMARGLNDVRKQFGYSTAAAGEFDIRQQKLISQSEQYAQSLKNQKVGMMEAVRNRGLFNKVLREQIALQHASSLAWSQDSSGRISSDLIIPKNLPAELVNTRQKMGLLNSMMASVSANTVNWGKNTQWAGRQLMTGLTMPIGLLAGATAALAFNMDKELTRVTKVYGDLTTGITESNQSIRDSAMATVEASASLYGTSAKDTLTIMSGLASAGKTGNELQQATMETNRIALAGELDIQDALKASISLQQAYKLDAEGLGDAFAYINAMENQTVLTSQDFVQAIPKVAGVMNALGADLKDVGTLMTAFKAGGIDALEGANALKTISFRGTAPYGKGAETFKQYTGKDLKDLVAATKGDVIPTLMSFGKEIQGLTKVQQVAVVKDVFGIYQGSKVFTVLQQMLTGSEQMKSAFSVANNSAAQNRAIMAREIKTMAEQPYAKIKKAWEGIHIQLAKIGAEILPIGAKVTQWILGLVKSFQDLSPGVKAFIMVGAAIVGLAGPIIMIVGLLANLIGNFGRLATFFTGLVLKFKITDAASRATALQGKLATSVWDLQSASVNRLTMSLDRLIASQQAAAIRVNPGLGIAGRPGYVDRTSGVQGPMTVGQTAGFIPPVQTRLTPATMPAGYSYNQSAGRYQDSRGRFVAESNIHRVMQQQQITAAQLARTQMAQQRALGAQLALQAELAMAERARLATATAAIRNVGSGAMMLGGIGMMVGGTDSLLGKISMVLMVVGTLGMVFASQMGRMAMAARAAAISISASLMSAMSGTRIGAWAASLSGMGPRIMAGLKFIGPALLAVGVAVFILWKNVNDAMERGRQKAEAFGKSTQTMAEVLAFSYQKVTPAIKEGVKATTEQVVEAAREYTQKNKGAADIFAGLFDFNDTSAKTEGERWAAAVSEGASVKLHGGTKTAAQDATRVAMALMGRYFSDAEWEAKIKVMVDFDDAEATLDASMKGLEHKMKMMLEDQGSDGENWFRNRFGQQDDLTAAGAAVAKDIAVGVDKGLNLVTPKGAKVYLDKFFASAQKPLEKSYTDIMKNATNDQKMVMESHGWTNAQEFAAGFGSASQDVQGQILKTLMLSDADEEKMAKQGDQFKQILTGIAEVAARMPRDQAEKIFGKNDLFKALLTSGRMAEDGLISTTEAMKNYQDRTAGAALGIEKLTDAQKLQILNEERLRAGLPATTFLMDGMNKKVTAIGESAKAAAPKALSLAQALASIKVPSSITPDVMIDSWKSTITGALDGVGSETTDRLAKEAEASMKATADAGTAAMDAIDVRAKKANEDADKIAEDTAERQQRQSERMQTSQQEASERLQTAQAEASAFLQDRQQKAQESLQARQQALQESLQARQANLQEAMQARQEAASERMQEQHQAASEALTARQNAQKKAFDDAVTNRQKVEEAAFDNKINNIEKAIKAEQDAENMRQKIFEAEKTRIQRLAEMYNKNVNLNMAINSGDLDQAAIIQNDMVSTQEQWSAGDVSEESKTSSENRVDALGKKKDKLTADKDRRLEILSIISKAEEEAMNARFERENKALKRSQTMQDRQLKMVQAREDKALKATLLRESKALKAVQDREGKALKAAHTRENNVLKAVQLRENKALKAAQLRENAALKAVHTRENKALKATKDGLAKRFDAEKKAQEKTNTIAAETAQSVWDTRQKGFAKELETLRAFVPRNEKEMKEQIARINKLYKKYGGTVLGPQGTAWGNIVANSLSTSVAREGNKLRTIINWAGVGSHISAGITQGAFGMTPTAMAKWIGGTAPAPPSSVFGSAPAKPKPKGPASDNISGESAKNRARRLYKDGGRIHGPGDGRSDSIRAWLSNGEFVVNAKQTAKHLPVLEAINKGKEPQFREPKFADGGLIGLPGMFAGMMGGMQRALINATWNAAANKRVEMDAATEGSADGNGSASGNVPLGSGKGNAQKVYNTLTSLGFTPQAAAGVIGNLMQESGMNPASQQGGGGPGRGIMQWSVNERFANMRLWAGKKDVWALQTQVQFMLKEMADYNFLGKYKKMTDVNNATLLFEKVMERAGSPNMSARYGFAQNALRSFGKGQQSMSILPEPGGAAGKATGLFGANMILPVSPFALARAAASGGGGETGPIPGIPTGPPIGGLAAARLIAFGKALQRMGFNVGEHPAFGGVAPVHSQNSWHYRNGAIDVNKDGKGQAYETAQINAILAMAKQYGLRTIWQYPNHYDHAHFDIGSGPDMGKGLKTGGFTLNDGYARLHKAETVLTAPLSKQLNEGIDRFANGPTSNYTIKADFNGANFATDVDVERAFQSLMEKNERRIGSSRRIGSGR